jgi:hypothetical protein
LLHQLARRLLGHAEVFGDVECGGIPRTDPDEREAVRRPDIRIPAARHRLLDALDDLRRDRQRPHRQLKGFSIHPATLTQRSSKWTI